MDNLFIAGTDTGIGKTVLSLLLMHYFYEKKFCPFYVKPFQTGCRDPYDTDSDARFIYSNIRQLREKDPAESVIFCYRNPKAPWFAGRDMGKQAQLEPIVKILSEKETFFNPIIVEGAGGILVPVTETLLAVDVVRTLGLKVVLAARSSLGTINHTLLTIEVMKNRGIEVTGVVFLDSGMVPTPKDLVLENMEAIKRFSGIQVAGTIGHIKDFFNPGKDHFPVFNRLFNGTIS
jgi:dethiobiotin synthetase